MSADQSSVQIKKFLAYLSNTKHLHEIDDEMGAKAEPT